MSAGVSTSGEWQNLDNDGAINGTDRDVLSCKCPPGMLIPLKCSYGVVKSPNH